MRRPFRLPLLLAAALCAAAPLMAQEQSDGRLQVLRPVIDARQDAAQLCLEFDHALAPIDRDRLAIAIRLTEDGKSVANLAADLSASGAYLCIQGLAHRRRYGLTVAGLKGAKGERLAGPYKLSFTVPDRPPSLAFVGDPGQGGLMRYQNADPVLRAVGIARVHIQLYRVEDPAAMAEAYRQRLQASLAPSESLAFARTHGKLMWQGEMALGEKNADPNRTAEQSVPLRAAAGALKPGLYLVAAETPAPEKTAKAKTAGRLPPLAAQWFLRSDLRLAALPAQGGFTAETENAAGTKVLKDVHLALSDRDRHILSESQSDKDGIGFLPLAKDKQAVLLAAADTQGDVDFVDLTAAPAVPFTLPALEATVTEDRVSYAPGAMAHLRLEARDIHGAAQGLKGSTLELLRPGGGFYAEVKVPDLDAGLAYAAFPAPPIEGLWQLVWQGKDQGEIAKTTLRVSANPAAPRIDLAADRAQLGPGGQLNLTVTSLGADHKPAPYIAGHILLHWDQPTALPGWPGYIFGTGTGSDEAPLPIAAFLTGADGTAHVRLAIAAAPADDAALQSAVLTAQGDPAMGALDSAPLALPLRAQTGVVGLKPLAPDGKFAENSLARFDVIALDGDGNRQDLAGLSYQVYEEGRRYSWYQADGHWQYKPLPQRQRIAGGVFAIPLQGTVIGWPVTAGAYTLDITDADGKLLARATAEAGWNLAKPEHAPAAPLTPKPSAPFAMPGAAEKISFRLDHASIVSAVIADDRIRKVIHAALPAGANSIAFTPGETWGNRIAITLDAHNGASRAEGRFEMPVHHNLKQLKISASPPAAITPGENLSLPVAIAGAEAGQPTYLSALAIPLPAEKNQTPESIAVKSVTVADGKAILHMTAPDFSGALRLDIMAVNRDQQGSTDVTIPVRPAFAATLAPPPILRKGDRAALALALANHAAPAGVFHYALIPAKGLALIGRVKGAESLALKRTAKIALDLEARGEGAQELRLDIKGPHNFGMARGWAVAVCDPGRILKAGDAQSIAPGQGWSLPQTKYGKRAAPYSLLLVSAAPLPGLPGLLPQLLAGAPVTTAEIAAWLEAARAWRDVIDEAGLAPGAALDARRAATLMRLLQRQNKDGAFPALSGGADDMDATASALVALAAADQPLTRPSAARAEDWLQGQLQNSWFNEAQRPARAAAFAALAAAGHQNLATLRYFAETSAGKELPPLAAAQLAAALAAGGDRDKAGAWLEKAQAGLGADPAPQLLAALAGNPLADTKALTPLLQKSAEKTAGGDPQTVADLLLALGDLAARAGNWPLQIAGRDRTGHGVVVAKPPEKTAGFALRNTGGRPLYVLPAAIAAPPPLPATLRRRLFRPDGGEIMDGRLARGAPTIMEIEGPWPQTGGKPAAEIAIHDALPLGLRVAGCALDPGTAVAPGWAWLGKLGLDRAASCAAESHGLNAVIAAPANAASASWHLAYPVEAVEPGRYLSGPVTLRALGAGNGPVTQIAQPAAMRAVEIR